MGKVDVYIGGYLPIDEVTKDEGSRLASSGCVIGMPLELVYNAEDNSFRLMLPSGDSIGTVRPHNKLAIREAIEENWSRYCWLSLVYYDNETKQFGGEVAFQMFHVKPSQTKEQANLEAYVKKTSERLASGKRPNIVLTGDSWDQVIETGDWEGDKTEPLPIDTKRNSGKVIYKRKRSISDRMVLGLMDRKPGCFVGVGIVLVALIVAIVFLVAKCSA